MVQQLIVKKSSKNFVNELNSRNYGSDSEQPNYICYASKPNSLVVTYVCRFFSASFAASHSA